MKFAPLLQHLRQIGGIVLAIPVQCGYCNSLCCINPMPDGGALTTAMRVGDDSQFWNVRDQLIQDFVGPIATAVIDHDNFKVHHTSQSASRFMYQRADVCDFVVDRNHYG